MERMDFKKTDQSPEHSDIPERKHGKYKAADVAADDLAVLLQNEQPNSFNLNWVRNRNRPLSRFMVNHASTSPDGSKDYSDILSQLPEEWQAKWEYTFHERDRSDFNSIVNDLEKIIREEDPPTYNAEWVKNNATKIYSRIYRNIKNSSDGKIDWARIISGLPEDLQSKWRVGYRDGVKEALKDRMKKFSYPEVVEKINEIISRANGRIITSRYIELCDKPLYKHICHNIRNNGDVDWSRIESDIRSDLKPKFKKPGKNNGNNVEPYVDKEETQKLLEKNANNLYTFFHSETPQEKASVNKVCGEFISLIQKGNQDAREKFWIYIKVVIDNWLDDRRTLSIYKFYPDELEKIANRCMDNYKPASEIPFLGYLHSYLSKASEKLRSSTKIIELDSPAQEGSSESKGQRFKAQ